jgi:ferric-dicitrate binding protein FerR (iron transport regulator)
MTESGIPTTDTEEERALRADLSVRALSPEALQRIRRAAETEWRATVGYPVRRRWIPYAAAASAVLLAMAGTWIFLARDSGAAGVEPIAQLARAEAPGVVELLPLWRESAVSVGTEIHNGQNLQTRGATLFALNGGGNLRLAAGSEFDVTAANAVRLDRGEMYVDIPPGSRPARSFVAITAAGEFRHVGTQFALAVIDGSTRLRVREGSVAWQAGSGESTVNAGTEVVIDRDRKVTRRALETSGSQWAWAESVAPDVGIEGRPLGEFLDWVARETGRKLLISDEHTRGQIAAIRMHGNIHGLEPLLALQAVMASTSLRFELPAGAIRVSFAGESQPTSL